MLTNYCALCQLILSISFIEFLSLFLDSFEIDGINQSRHKDFEQILQKYQIDYLAKLDIEYDAIILDLNQMTQTS